MEIIDVQTFCIYGIPLPEPLGGPTKYARLLHENSPHLTDENGKYFWEVLNMGHQIKHREMSCYLALEHIMTSGDYVTPCMLDVRKMAQRSLTSVERAQLKEVCEYFGVPYEPPKWYLAFNTM